MKDLGTTKTGLTMVAAAVILLILLVLVPSGLSSAPHPAEANPGLTVGLDMNPSTTTDTNGDGVYESIPSGAILENCIDVSVNDQFSIDFFVLDVNALAAFEADLMYNGSVIEVDKSFTGTTPSNPNGKLFMSAQSGSNVYNASQNSPNQLTGVLATPDTDGHYEAAAADYGNEYGDTGSGVLARLTLKATAAGVSTLDLTNLDFNSDGTFDTGVMLRDANLIRLNDTNPADGFYDGPFINLVGTIAIDQPDADGDGVSDICDNDSDGDGVSDPDDNCPTVYNPAPQADMDNDGFGDVCDGDIDGDGYWNDKETKDGSNPNNNASKPEVCDGVDNDLDASVDEGYNYNGNNGPDCTENVDSDADGTANPSDTDDDNDGFLDVEENWTASDSLKRCPSSSTHDAWPPDVNNDGDTDIFDILLFKPHFLTDLGEPKYDARFDLNGDGSDDIFDILKVKPFFMKNCAA